MADRKSYSELLRDPRWQRKRLEILQRSDFSCEICAATDKTLNVHHKVYRRGAMPWEYESHELQALCEDCHHEHHELLDLIQAALARLGSRHFEQVLGYIDAVALRGEFPSHPPLPPALATENAGCRSAEHARGMGHSIGLVGREGEHYLATAELTKGRFFDLMQLAWERNYELNVAGMPW